MDTLQHAISTGTTILYSPLMLVLLGMAGILLHNLVHLRRLNNKGPGSINYGKYLKEEIFSILISIVLVLIVALVLKAEVLNYFSRKIPSIEMFVGCSMVLWGYSCESWFIKLTGQAEKTVDSINSKADTDNP